MANGDELPYVVNLDSAWDMAVEEGLDGCFPPDMKSFDGYQAYFDDLAARCDGARTGGALMDVVRRNTDEWERWFVIFRRLDEPDQLGYNDPAAYIIRGFERVDK